MMERSLVERRSCQGGLRGLGTRLVAPGWPRLTHSGTLGRSDAPIVSDLGRPCLRRRFMLGKKDFSFLLLAPGCRCCGWCGVLESIDLGHGPSWPNTWLRVRALSNSSYKSTVVLVAITACWACPFPALCPCLERGAARAGSRGIPFRLSIGAVASDVW
jgi:hypothetical protein